MLQSRVDLACVWTRSCYVRIGEDWSAYKRNPRRLTGGYYCKGRSFVRQMDWYYLKQTTFFL